MMKNILIVQNFNPNKGNSSVISATLHVLSEADVNVEITSALPEKGREQYNVNCYDWLVTYRHILYSKTKTKKILALLSELFWVFYLFIWIIFFKFKIQLPVPKRKKATLMAYKRADVIVFPGGHSFTTMNGFGQVFSHCIGFYFGKILHKKTMIYAHTIGPFNGRFSHIIKSMSLFVIKRTDLITIREKDSMKYCSGCNAILTAETVFSLPTDLSLALANTEFRTIRQNTDSIVGLTIHHIYYKYFFSKQEYIDKMSKIIDSIIGNYGSTVLLIPMENKTGNYNDRDMANEIKEKLQNKDKFVIIQGDYESDVTASIIGNCDMFIGTKTHSIVYGLKSEVPTLSVAYQQKANEFMEMYGVLENSINLSDLELEPFMSIFDRIYHNFSTYREIEHKHNMVVRAKSLENRDLLLKLLNQ